MPGKVSKRVGEVLAGLGWRLTLDVQLTPPEGEGASDSERYCLGIRRSVIRSWLHDYPGARVASHVDPGDLADLDTRSGALALTRAGPGGVRFERPAWYPPADEMDNLVARSNGWPGRAARMSRRGAAVPSVATLCLSLPTLCAGRGRSPATLRRMSRTVHGHVSGGRLHVDEAVDLPEGAQVELVIVDTEDGLDDDDRARLHEAIDEAEAELARGEGIPLGEVLDDARAAFRM